ncbi:hypothetical protein RB614_35045 [Phytohabitans sp. ZYX-F-186]|uniref:Uncharacterized protein n=1 Tax=Phytohabitans maris TaxID=3071409 RepID=A0ABU0ZRV3_9ACTN|nr:hypothetical protein [Phytohabitans sp. ZYX-F-186]MDQ7909751.1 hypothetical protein [Phytohabitans sp. ZYX-F-186]
MIQAVGALSDRLLGLLVTRADAAAACPTERYAQYCFCDCPAALAYYRWCTVQSTCSVICGACWPSDIRCCV